MDRQRVSQRDGKVFVATKVEIVPGWFIDPSYQIVLLVGSQISPTGLLRVFELSPDQGSLPRFIGRWDERADRLDIDILNVPQLLRGAFKRGWFGYRGHHPKSVHGDTRRYRVEIWVSHRKIFDGEVSA